jgi:hypothetical protein
MRRSSSRVGIMLVTHTAVGDQLIALFVITNSIRKAGYQLKGGDAKSHVQGSTPCRTTSRLVI